MDAVSLWFRMQWMKIESRQIQLLKTVSALQSVQASYAAGLQIVCDVSSSAFCEKLLQAFVPEADDHPRSVT